MTQEILGTRELEIFIGEWKLIPSTGGKFEVTINGDLVYSKKALGRHAEEGEVRRIIEEYLQPLIPEGFVMPEK